MNEVKPRKAFTSDVSTSRNYVDVSSEKAGSHLANDRNDTVCDRRGMTGSESRALN